jgi:hypothetical protein
VYFVVKIPNPFFKQEGNLRVVPGVAVARVR